MRWSDLSMRRLRLLAGRAGRSLWFRPAVYALAAVAAAALSPLLRAFLPGWIITLVSEQDLRDLLGLIASSMLAIAIFSLGTMLSALQGAAGAATPRARPLLSQDKTAQTAISSFIGAFVFSVVGLVALALETLDAAGRAALYAVTLAMVALVIATMIAWLRRLSTMGGVGEAVDLVEATTRRALAAEAQAPCCGGRPSLGPPSGVVVRADAFGFVLHVDGGALSRIGQRLQADVHVAAAVGAPVRPGAALAVVAGLAAEADRAAVRAAFWVGGARVFDEDPRLGLVTLSEIASRALSPAVNDPGTALDVIATQTRVLGEWRRAAAGPAEPAPRLYAPPLAAEDLLGDAFRAVARDGAGLWEVSERLHGALAALAAVDPDFFGDAARAMSAEAAARSAVAAAWPEDAARVERLRAELGL